MKRIILVQIIILQALFSFSQGINKVVFDEKANQDIILGICNEDGLTSGSFNEWFDLEYESYEVNKDLLDQINRDMLADINIYIVMGTWCSDSKREVPRFLKILDYLDFFDDQLIIIGVNSGKQAEKTGVERMNIELVPTIIFYFDNAEIGRIIESPVNSLEEDMFKILSEN